MNNYRPIITTLTKRILILFLIYQLNRLCFYFLSYSNFSDLSVFELLKICFFGIRFDAFSIFSGNSLFILLCLLPFNFYYSKKYQTLLFSVFIITNSLFILLNCIDFAYYPFNQKRLTFDFLSLMFTGETEFLKLLPHFLIKYWYLIFIYTFFVYLIIKSYKITKYTSSTLKIELNLKNVSLSLLYFLIYVGVTILCMRGGLQRIPIVLLDAAAYTKPNFIPILINSPFSVLKTSDLEPLKPISVIPEDLEKKYFNPIHSSHHLTNNSFKNYNVCVIILESFSKEFFALGKRKSYTPFLDSLLSKSLVFENGIANGKTSINGIPAVIASLPCFLDNPYINSIYSNNVVQSLPSLLKSKNYTSVFFHGGTNGTMNFDAFAKIAGYDKYYGRTEYKNDTDYDGQWGIFDEPFLQKVAEEMSSLKQPFFSSIFTLSSHNPYKVPEKYKGKFPKGNYDITETIGYSDFSLKCFFEKIKNQPWFDKTLFVITSDHTAASEDKFYASAIGQHFIPIAFYNKNITPEINKKTVQQIDILPTVLNYLNYDTPYYSFGNNMLDTLKKPCLFYVGPHYYCVNDSFVYTLSNFNFIEKFNFKTDSLTSNNLKTNSKDKELEVYCKAYIQKYTNDVIANKTYYSK